MERVMDSKKILETEYNPKFDELRKNRMVVSYHKYGPVKENYGNHLVDAIASMEKRIDFYKKTGNTEYLVDVANFAMIEFTYPQHSTGHFAATDSDKSPGVEGTTYREIEKLSR